MMTVMTAGKGGVDCQHNDRSNTDTPCHASVCVLSASIGHARQRDNLHVSDLLVDLFELLRLDDKGEVADVDLGWGGVGGSKEEEVGSSYRSWSVKEQERGKRSGLRSTITAFVSTTHVGGETRRK